MPDEDLTEFYAILEERQEEYIRAGEPPEGNTFEDLGTWLGLMRFGEITPDREDY